MREAEPDAQRTAVCSSACLFWCAPAPADIVTVRVTGGPVEHRLLNSFAVGTPVARRPPRRSQRAALPHWAPASGQKAESLVRPGVHDARAWEEALGDPSHLLPGDLGLMAAAAETALP